MPSFRRLIRQLRQERAHKQRKAQQLDEAIVLLRKLGGPSRGRGVGRPRRRISAAGRRRIVAAQRARWAKIKQQKAA